MSEHRQGSTSSSSTAVGGLGRASSQTSSISKPPPVRAAAPAASYGSDPAPPPYTTGGAPAAAGALGAKRAPPPPPAPKPRPGAAAIQYVTALYDYAATVRFSLGDALRGRRADRLQTAGRGRLVICGRRQDPACQEDGQRRGLVDGQAEWAGRRLPRCVPVRAVLEVLRADETRLLLGNYVQL